jgi:tetratricopeptide (TPR) repeat protein
LHSQENIVKNDQAKQDAVAQARRELEHGRVSPTNVLDLANAMADLETEAAYNEALELLAQHYRQTRDFTFQRRRGELKLRFLRGQIRDAEQQLKNQPENAVVKEQRDALIATLDQEELEHFRICQENYPTDLRFKYEYGRCLVRAQQFDQAIPFFQEAQRDPKLHLLAMDKTGLCFLLKGWHEDAIDIFQRAIKACPTQESPIAKDIKYNLARTYEASGQGPQALEIYRKLAQLDFSYKDIGQRIDFLRKNGTK